MLLCRALPYFDFVRDLAKMATDDDVNPPSSQDVVAIYHRLMAEDPELSMPIAGIESLIEILGSSQVKTVHETINLIKAESEKLKDAVENSIALSHGTDLLQQYLLLSINQPSGHENFEVVRQHLVRNGRLFITRAKNARERIAVVARKFIYEGYIIMTFGGSRVVRTLLNKAAQKHDFGHYVDQPIRFKVVYVVGEQEADSDANVKALRAEGIQVATIPFCGVSHAMAKVDIVIVGAEAVTANGGMISGLGTFQIAEIAKARNKQFFVAAEQFKVGKTFPLDQYDFDFGDQRIVDFDRLKAKEAGAPFKEPMANPIDYTPPQYIQMFFADHKVMSPREVAKEVIDMMA